jgi:hypothetical protein
MADCLTPRSRWWLKFVCTHNPCYVISALLVLYGLHLSFADGLDPARGWLLLRLIAGYVLLLAAAAIAVVRLGRVWEDARTLALLVALMFIAISGSFDRVCLDDSRLGARFLGVGFAFAVAVTELLIRGLNVRLPWTYRGPFYLQLGVLFAYPAWLGELSITDREPMMAWFVLGYSSLQTVLTLLLMPAVVQRGRRLSPNGTPWSWPWYPMTLPVVFGVGAMIRGYAMSFSFSVSKEFVSGLDLYWLIPLALAWMLLWAEGAAVRGPAWRRTAACLAPLALLAFALPGESRNDAQALYLSMLQQNLGSPIQIAACLLAVYYLYLWTRGLELAEFGVLVSLAVLTVSAPYTVDLHALAPIQPAPALALVVLLAGLGSWRRSSARICLAILLLAAGTILEFPASALAANRGYLAIHLALAAIMMIGLIFNDWLARQISGAASVILPAAAVVAAAGYRFAFPRVSATTNVIYLLTLTALAIAYWRRRRRLDDLYAALLCASVLCGAAAERALSDVFAQITLRGKRWILWGGIFLAAGFVVSLIKGGQFRRLRRLLIGLHVWTRRTGAG